MAQADRNLHPEFIKAELRARFGSLSEVARMLGLSLKTVSGAIREPGRSSVVERRVAELLEAKPEDLWPDRWFANGQPRQGLRQQHKRKAA